MPKFRDTILRVLMGVPNYQLTTNFSANCQLTTNFSYSSFLIIITIIIVVIITTRTGIIIYYNGHRRDALLVRLSQFWKPF